MVNLRRIVVLLLFIATCPIAYGVELWVDEVDIKSEDGKDLIMKFEEIERHANYSIVRVQYTSGASVPSVMFIVRGVYNIAKIRGKKYFVNLKEWHDPDGNWMYKEGFVDSKDINLFKMYGDGIKKDIEEDAFMSVEEYDLLWGKNATPPNNAN